MKKFLYILLILVIITFLVWGYYSIITVRIKFDANEISHIEIFIPGASIDTKDKNKILKITKYLNSIKYWESPNSEPVNESPDARVLIYGENEENLDRIWFYGDIVVYKGKRYKIFYWTSFIGLENLCKRLRS